MPAAVHEKSQRPSRLMGLAEELLTLDDVAAVLRCSKAHVSNLINGKVLGLPPLPVVKIGRRKLVRRQSLAQWIKRAEGSSVEKVI